MADAKRLFFESASWAMSHDEFVDKLETVASELESAVTIYVALRDEGVPVWRPVAAAHIAAETYRILSANSEHPDEAWEFDRGDLVRCADRMLSGTYAKVAVARVSNGAG